MQVPSYGQDIENCACFILGFIVFLESDLWRILSLDTIKQLSGIYGVGGAMLATI